MKISPSEEYSHISNKKFIKSLIFTIGLIFFLTQSIVAFSGNTVYAAPSQKYAYQYLQMNQVLPTLFSGVLEAIDSDLTVVSRDCGEINAFYMRQARQIILCYEYVHRAEEVIGYLYPKETAKTRSALMTGVLMAALLHELGHAIIDLKDIHVLGNQEDAADSIATIIMVEFAKKSPQEGKTMIVGSLAHDWHTKADGLTKIFAGNDLYANEHPLNEQRVFNRLCLAYGSNPGLFIDSARQLKLPPKRAERCQKEYQDTKIAVDQLMPNNPK